MSIIHTDKIICPNCGKEFDGELYDSVNVTLDNDLKGKVLDGSIFDFNCPHCDEKSRIIYPILYHDMDRHYMIQLAATKNQIEEFQYMCNPTDMLPQLRSAFCNQNYVLRGVLSYRDLISKIHILDSGYDDRIVELMREDIVEHVKTKLKEAKKRGKVEFCLFVPNPDSNDEVVCLVFLHGQEKAYAVYGLPHVLYKEYLSHYYDRLQHSRAALIDEEFWDKMKHADKISPANSYEQDMRDIYCVYDTQGIFHLCMEKTPVETPKIKLVFSGINDNEEPRQKIISNGSYVFIEGNNTRLKCKVVKHLRESWYSLPKWDSHYDWIIATSDGFGLETTKDSDAILDDEVVKVALRKYNESPGIKEETQLFKALDSIDAIVLFDVLFSDADIANLVNAKVGDKLTTQNEVQLVAHKVVKNDKRYLAIYTNQNEVDKGLTKCIYNFTQIRDLVNHTDRVNGLIINPNTDSVVIEYVSLDIFDSIKHW